MRPPSTLLPSHTVLWLFCTTLLMFYNIAAEAQQSEEQPQPIGLAGIIPNEKGIVELHDDSWYITEKEQLVGYGSYEHKDTTFDSCNVDISGDELFYDDMAAKVGCTVDLLVNKMDRALFTAKMKNINTDCISKAENEDDIVEKSNDNLIPFVFGYPNNILKILSKIPAYKGKCPNDKAAAECKKAYNEQDGKCITGTMLEIGWSSSKDESIYGHLHQVGEPVSSWYIKMDKGEWNGMMDVELKISGNEKPIIEYHIRKSGTTEGFQFIEEKEGDQPICNIPNEAIRTPSSWEIKSTDQFLNGKHLLSLHFFQQSATVYHKRENGQWKMDETRKSNGPKCKGQSFVFPRSFAKGILMGPEASPTTPSTQSTIEMTTGSEGTATGSSRMPDETAATSEFPVSEESTTTSIGSSETTSEQADGESTNKILIIGIVAGAIVLIILVALLVYCLCCRKRGVPIDEEITDVDGDVEKVDADENEEQPKVDNDENEEQASGVGEMPTQMESQQQNYEAIEIKPAAAEKPDQIESPQSPDYEAIEIEPTAAAGDEKATQSQDYEVLW